MPIPSLGIVSFNTNLVSIGVNYSQNGGWSGSYMGVEHSRNGVSFNPSVGMSLTKSFYSYSDSKMNNIDLSLNSDGEVEFTMDNVLKMLGLFKYDPGLIENIFLGGEKAGNQKYNPVSGTYGDGAGAVTEALKQYDFKKSNLYFGKSAFYTRKTLFMVMQHELVHVALNGNGLGFDFTKVRPGNKEDCMRLAQEVVAYNITLRKADRWNDFSMQSKADDGYKNNLKQLSSYFRGNLTNMPNYSSYFNMSKIIRNVTPW